MLGYVGRLRRNSPLARVDSLRELRRITRASGGAKMSDREFTDITADVDALLADPSHALAIASARESLARADREWANVSTQASAQTVEPHRAF